MIDSLNLDEMIKYKIAESKLFVKKDDVNKDAINFKASIIYILTNFLKVTDIENLSFDELKEELLHLYQEEHNDMLKQMIHQIGPYVKNSIGFSIDVKDYNHARMYYELNYKPINALYEDLKLRRKKRQSKKKA